MGLLGSLATRRESAINREVSSRCVDKHSTLLSVSSRWPTFFLSSNLLVEFFVSRG